MAKSRKPGIYPNAEQLVRAKLAPAAPAAAEAYADALRQNVSRGARSGEPIPGKSYRRSSPSEFPQEDESDLAKSVDARPTANPLHAQGGFFGQPQGKVFALEYGYDEGGLEERAPNQRTADQPETQKAMLDAAVKAVKGG